MVHSHPIQPTFHQPFTKPQIIKSKVDEITKKLLEDEQTGENVDLAQENPSKIDELIKLMKAHIKISADTNNMVKMISKKLSAFSKQELKEKIPFKFPIDELSHVIELEKWVQSDEENYLLYVSDLIIYTRGFFHDI